MKHKAAPKELQLNYEYNIARTSCGIDIHKKNIVTSEYRISCPRCMEKVIADLDFKLIALKESLSAIKIRQELSQSIKLARHSEPSLDKN